MIDIVVRETRWYLSFQDGPAEHGKTYASEREAYNELERWKKEYGTGAWGVCIMSRTIFHQLEDYLGRVAESGR